MSDVITITDSFIEKDNTWIVDFKNIDFITWKENYDTKSYFVKLHIGAKETRLQLGYKEEVEELITSWKKSRGENNDK